MSTQVGAVGPYCKSGFLTSPGKKVPKSKSSITKKLGSKKKGK